jgi:hypothetical protein
MPDLHLFYLSRPNLMDRLFLKSFYDNFQRWQKPAIVFHEYIEPNPENAKFLSKRISAQLSENLITNIPISCGTKNAMFVEENQELNLNESVIEKFLETVSVVILNPVVGSQAEEKLIEPLQALKLWRKHNPVMPFIFFPENPLTPLTRSKISFGANEKRDKLEELLIIYPEEKNALELSFRFAPSFLASSSNFYV